LDAAVVVVELVVVVGAQRDQVLQAGGAAGAVGEHVVGDDLVAVGLAAVAAVRGAAAGPLGGEDEPFGGGRGALGVADLHDLAVGVQDESGEGAGAQQRTELGAGQRVAAAGAGGERAGPAVDGVEGDGQVGVDFVAGAERAAAEQPAQGLAQRVVALGAGAAGPGGAVGPVLRVQPGQVRPPAAALGAGGLGAAARVRGVALVAVVAGGGAPGVGVGGVVGVDGVFGAEQGEQQLPGLLVELAAQRPAGSAVFAVQVQPGLVLGAAGPGVVLPGQQRIQQQREPGAELGGVAALGVEQQAPLEPVLLAAGRVEHAVQLRAQLLLFGVAVGAPPVCSASSMLIPSTSTACSTGPAGWPSMWLSGRSRNGRARPAATVSAAAARVDSCPARSAAATAGTVCSRRANASAVRSTPGSWSPCTQLPAQVAPSSWYSSRRSTSDRACRASADSRSVWASSTRVRSSATAPASSVGLCPARASTTSTSACSGADGCGR